jgi:hypothetical protein
MASECPLRAEIRKPLPIAVDNRIGARGCGAMFRGDQPCDKPEI